MKRSIILCMILGFAATSSAQKLAIKNNALADATLSPNLALEIGLGAKTTLDIYGSYNPFVFNNNTKFKHWLAQPEFRYWICEKFDGTFFGLHAHGAQFNVAAMDLPFGLFDKLKDHRYQGYLYGAGLSVGYQWILAPRWNLEASIGGGYARIHYDQYDAPKCSPKLRSCNANYFGITKATVSLVFLIR